MKSTLHTTNYTDTLITVADDCPFSQGVIPPLRGDKKSIARQQYDLIETDPYQYTSDDVIFRIHADRQNIAPADRNKARQAFFAKGQPCFRASPLGKRYGWGIHADHEGKIAVYGVQSLTYQQLMQDPHIKKVKAMRSSRSS